METTINKNNVKFIHSNSYCKYNIDNYKKYNIEKILFCRRINSKKPNSNEFEIIISN